MESEAAVGFTTPGERIGKCGDAKKGEGKPQMFFNPRAASLRAKGGKAAIAPAVPRNVETIPIRIDVAKQRTLQYYKKEQVMLSKQCKAHLDEVGETGLQHMGKALKTAVPITTVSSALIVPRSTQDCLHTQHLNVMKRIQTT